MQAYSKKFKNFHQTHPLENNKIRNRKWNHIYVIVELNSLEILTKGPTGNVESHGSVAMCLVGSWQSCNAS